MSVVLVNASLTQVRDLHACRQHCSTTLEVIEVSMLEITEQRRKELLDMQSMFSNKNKFKKRKRYIPSLGRYVPRRAKCTLQ